MKLDTNWQATEQTNISLNDVRGSIVFKDVVKKYGAVHAVDGVDLEIEHGELVTLLGPSGCGKTTTLRMIAGLELPSTGTISIGGTDVSRLPATYRNVSMVFQSYALFPHLTVLDNVAYGLRMSGTKISQAREKAEDALSMVGLAGFGARLPSELSGGQQQRVALARAIVLEPEVLLLDEPLSNLDAKLRRYVREEIRALQQRIGVTTVYVTHDQEEAMAVSDRIIVMEQGRIAQAGSPADLYHSPKSAFIASFIGEANLIPCVAAIAADGSRIAEISNYTFAVPKSEVSPGEATLVIRPAAISFSANADEGIPSMITSAAFLGDRVLYSIETPIGRLFYVEYTASIRHPDRTEVNITLDPAKLHLV
ncbi:ABC transporter ATP-binding protein [Phyllobacterium myrsinacearum]|uniref:Iron(III) transport system ATP-binding protein n=1 Tax=Phyllobacterium myrsinacearum TaxID=28101 RepID=A0A839EL00_9HYPH|nr:ABC transporter ATP-binding protein [Phyllobacterium myrsinacearum]MBA8879542.1 iron(III) transport system ATP-binding protein [Phyllobacterium myrsinacearum]